MSEYLARRKRVKRGLPLFLYIYATVKPRPPTIPLTPHRHIAPNEADGFPPLYRHDRQSNLSLRRVDSKEVICYR